MVDAVPAGRLDVARHSGSAVCEASLIPLRDPATNAEFGGEG